MRQIKWWVREEWDWLWGWKMITKGKVVDGMSLKAGGIQEGRNICLKVKEQGRHLPNLYT